MSRKSKYSWNQVSYELYDGSLPAGMIVKPNGELYGVPTEAGTFTFTVEMTNSYGPFGSSTKTYTMTVKENTDANVDAATDSGYDLTQRVQYAYDTSAGDQLMVSQGVYGEFVDLYLDGVKLTDGVDYTSESGSTRITIYSQTLTNNLAE
ncbi:putative Ig domain-containing protein, partial [uncultured Ligilactobacillus sp.]|uniref:putative Ig domain-containing protein n=1 Tax=uncultured Ligilactobacillus sp. TaxID=2837633 RepID=UPI00272BD09B